MCHLGIISKYLQNEQGFLIISFPISLPSQFGIILFAINLFSQPKREAHIFFFPEYNVMEEAPLNVSL